MSPLARVRDVFDSLVGPWLFMATSASWFPTTLTSLLRERKYGVLLSPSKFQSAWFGNFWGSEGPNVKEGAQLNVIPLLEGRTSGGRIVDEPTGPGIGGTILEIGPGSGFWVDIFSDKHLAIDESGGKASGTDTGRTGTGQIASRNGSARKKATRVYGVEPNRDQHASLRHKIAEAGLEGVYQIVPVGIENLDNPSQWDGKVEKGSVDCIVSILCLCSIPEPQKNCKELYAYLKKGGRWYVYEHVRVDRNWGVRMYQAFVNLFWPHFIGGCQICRPTEKWLREAGPWEKIDVGHLEDEEWHHVLPHILGVFTK